MLHSWQDRCSPNPKKAWIIQIAPIQTFSGLVQSAVSLTETTWQPFLTHINDPIPKRYSCELVGMADLKPHNYVLRFFSFS